MIDAPTKAIIVTIRAAGFDVQVGIADAPHVVEAVNQRSGDTFVVRGDDPYAVFVELAQQGGMELEDG